MTDYSKYFSSYYSPVYDDDKKHKPKLNNIQKNNLHRLRGFHQFSENNLSQLTRHNSLLGALNLLKRIHKPKVLDVSVYEEQN